MLTETAIEFGLSKTIEELCEASSAFLNRSMLKRGVLVARQPSLMLTGQMEKSRALFRKGNSSETSAVHCVTGLHAAGCETFTAKVRARFPAPGCSMMIGSVSGWVDVSQTERSLHNSLPRECFRCAEAVSYRPPNGLLQTFPLAKKISPNFSSNENIHMDGFVKN